MRCTASLPVRPAGCRGPAARAGARLWPAARWSAGCGRRTERSGPHRSAGRSCPPGRTAGSPTLLPAARSATIPPTANSPAPRRAGKAVQLGNVQEGVDGSQFHGVSFGSAAVDAGDGQCAAVHLEVDFQPGKLHAVHPLRVVLVGGAGSFSSTPAGRPAGLRGPWPRASPGRRRRDGGTASAP